MSPIRVDSLSAEKAAPIFNWLLNYAFSSSPPIPDPKEFGDRLQHLEGYNKFLVLYEDDEPASCGTGGAMTQNVRGKLVDAAGIGMVATHPSHRRKGYSYVLLKELLQELRDAGFGFSTLYPFRESFYERLGYANWPKTLTAEINIRSLAPLLKQTFDTQLELLEYVKAPEVYHEFMRLYQPQVHGAALFKKQRPPHPDWHKAWLLVSRRSGKLDGVMLYTIKETEITKSEFDVKRFYALSPDSRYHFLHWIARHIDQAGQVTLNLAPFEQPNTWLSDLDIKVTAKPIWPMGRVLDIQKLNGLPVGEGRFTAKVVDPICPWNEGAWSFTGQDGTLHVSRTDSTDCWLGIQGLSSLVFGTVPPENYPFRGWGEIPEKVLPQLRSLFPPQIPHLHEKF